VTPVRAPAPGAPERRSFVLAVAAALALWFASYGVAQ
jgi:hypothetical protein